MTQTATVHLTRGYVDEQNVAHRKVTLRVPTMRDEVKRDQYIAERGLPGDAAQFLALVLQVIVEWEGIPLPAFSHLEALTRGDFRRLVNALGDLESDDAEANLGKSPTSEDDSSPPTD